VNLVPGTYRLYITWKADPQGATNATYKVYDNTPNVGNEIGSDIVDQSQSPPNDAIPVTKWQCCTSAPQNEPPDECPYDGNYEDLVSCGRWDAEAGQPDYSIQHKYGWYEIAGGPFQIDSTVMSLVLEASGANGRVHADAVWLEREDCVDSPYDPPSGDTVDSGPDPCDLPPLDPAIEDGLHWIVEHQQADGSWLMQHSGAPGTNGPPCGGQCANDGTHGGYSGAPTGWGIIALLSAGYTPVSGPEYYRNSLCKAINWMMDYQMPSGGYMHFGTYDAFGICEHLVAQYAMAEALAAMDLALDGGMSGSTSCEDLTGGDCEIDKQRLRASVQLGTNFTIQERCPYDPDETWHPIRIVCNKGGWHYRNHHHPNDFHYENYVWADVLNAGWGTLAIKASAMAGINVDANEFTIADASLDSMELEKEGFPIVDGLATHYDYGTWGHNNIGLDAGAIMGRLLLGTAGNHGAISWWLTNIAPTANPYHTFFGSRAAHYAGDNTYLTGVRAALAAAQTVNPGGHDHGSWAPEGGQPAGYCGRHLATCMAVAALAEIDNGVRLQP
jgi:hypothetical protein